MFVNIHGQSGRFESIFRVESFYVRRIDTMKSKKNSHKPLQNQLVPSIFYESLVVYVYMCARCFLFVWTETIFHSSSFSRVCLTQFVASGFFLAVW